MKWRRLGRIFDPEQFNLIEGQCGYAQSPQALVCDGFVRIYFSTRVRDSHGMFVSHVAYVDFDPGLGRIIDHSRGPVIRLGPLGSFDEHGIFPMNVLRVGDEIHAFTTGWSRRRSVAVDAAIGWARSHDGGRTFEKFGEGPILAASLDQPFLVGDAFVAHFDDRFHMWYIHGTKWIQASPEQQPDRVYKIAHASSADCIDWTRSSRPLVADRLGADECQALPTVVRLGDRYHMWFCYRHATDFRTNPARGYRIGHASSADMVSWQRDDDEGGLAPSPDGWDSEMLCYPHAFHHAGRLYLLYNGNEFGRFGFGLAVLEQGS
ncbi:MAG: hypothetical protein HZA63_11045 [Rhodocyclales bacterium]|nr:hypothetical protein [Rhodocyclales bacterium]